MKALVLVRYGEIALKKGNRSRFEKILVKNIRARLVAFKDLHIHSSEGRILIDTSGDTREVLHEAAGVFGVVGTRLIYKVPTEWEEILSGALSILKDDPRTHSAKIFAIRAKRKYKGFPFTSEDIGRELGSQVIDTFPNWTVGLKNPEVCVRVDVHKDDTYISVEEVQGPGGLPVGTAGRLGFLLSGGIDSPVAGYLMQKRGAEIFPIYFHSFPYTGNQALNKVKDLARVLARNQFRMDMWIVHFTHIQETIHERCLPRYGVILNRRMMVRLAEKISLKENYAGLVTGDCLGQVASQTLGNMDAVGQATGMQIYRPILTYDKTEITKKARLIGTYDISIRPYEDCCTLFVDTHPTTNAGQDIIRTEEKKLDIEELIEDALKKTKIEKIK
ncbi:tRNA 4-thiouridine(8) synthase ThiI [PVC group bacterium]|nr:tRNA 4-thiouridine(8) synthase ThiI [PVC group bacterium]